MPQMDNKVTLYLGPEEVRSAIEKYAKKTLQGERISLFESLEVKLTNDGAVVTGESTRQL